MLSGKDLTNRFVSSPKASFQNITVEEFDKVTASRDPFVVDVHVPEQKHIVGTDMFIDYREVKNRLNEFPKDKSAEIIVYCRSGNMSTEAAQVLADAGYTNVNNLIGGVNAYREIHTEVVIEPKVKGLGTVIYGDVARTEFTLANNTGSNLKIVRVSTSCGCTKAKVEKEVLDPYESTKVAVSFDPAVHKDDTDIGDIERTFYIKTDNINFPEVEAKITAKVVKR